MNLSIKKKTLLSEIIKILSLFSHKTDDNAISKSSKKVVCQNGIFEGTCEEETGVLSFKGIPYAKAPIGELRWKAPQEVEQSDEVIKANEYGKSGIQRLWHSEDITTDVGEDCLTLNIWTNSLESKNKAVMVFFHGGAFAWGGSSMPLYNGQYIVNEHNDVIVVTCNYRIGIMGFVDFNNVIGGENYIGSNNLGLLDCIQALRWIKKNIEGFGGDPNNVTIFGESAGGIICSSLLLSDAAGDLFQRAIVESGPISLTIDSNRSKENTDNIKMLMKYTGAKNMEDLLKLQEKELIEANQCVWDENGTTINHRYKPIVRDANPINDCSYEAFATSKAKDVDLLIGTNLDELCYWKNEMNDLPLSMLNDKEIELNIDAYNKWIDGLYGDIINKVSDKEIEYISQYLGTYVDLSNKDALTRLLSDLYYRTPSIITAEKHSISGGTGKTFMYLFEKENTRYDFMKACHFSELSYVFHNLDSNVISGDINKKLADEICEAWVNFAKTGNPSTSNVKWDEYDINNRMTMIMGNDNSLVNVSDPYSKERKLLSNLINYYFKPTGA